MSTISYLYKKHLKTLLKISYLLFYEQYPNLKTNLTQLGELSLYPIEHVKYLRAILNIYRDRNGYKKKIKMALEISRDSDHIMNRTTGEKATINIEKVKNSVRSTKDNMVTKKLGNKNIHGRKSYKFLEAPLKFKNQHESDTDFTNFIVLEPPSHPFYQALTRDTRALRPILFEQMEKCLICGEMVYELKDHVMKCLKRNRSNQNMVQINRTEEKTMEMNKTNQKNQIETNSQQTKHSSVNHDQIKLSIDLPTINISTLYTFKTLISEIKTELSQRLNIAKSKLHIFDGNRPLKNGDNAESKHLIVKYKKR